MLCRLSPGTIALAAAALACGRGSPDSSPSGSALAGGPMVTAASSTTGVRSSCPATGQWAVCSVEQRIRRAGLVAQKIEGDSTARAAFRVKPRVYTLGRDSRLELFFYPSAAALASDIEKMDTIKVAPRGASEKWTVPPTLIRSANLAAVLLSHDAREADRLFLALTAGPPSAVR